MSNVHFEKLKVPTLPALLMYSNLAVSRVTQESLVAAHHVDKHAESHRRATALTSPPITNFAASTHAAWPRLSWLHVNNKGKQQKSD
jgi:hypothetical protein